MTTSSRRAKSLIARPRISSLLPSEYRFAVSKKLMPPSRALWMKGRLYAFGGAEAVQRKSRTFFLNAARDAQIEISQHITKNKKPRSAPASGRRRAAARPAATRIIPPPPIDPPSVNNGGLDGSTPRAPNAYQLLAVLDLSDMSEDEQAAVWTLIQYLKRKEIGAPVGKQRRDTSKSRPAAAASVPEAKEGTDGTALAE
jgi:hypothetical protein